jgi:hypothetical protein
MHAGINLRLERKARRDAGGAGRGGEDLRLAGIGRSGGMASSCAVIVASSRATSSVMSP